MHLRLSEPVGIDPRVDIVLHKLFGDPANEAVLLDFLNAVLAWPVPIVRATVQNPFTPELYAGHRGLILDIRAEDELGRIYQIEMQRRNDTSLSQRILWSWARVYAAELDKGEDHADLQPVIAVWICESDLFPAASRAHLRFQMREEVEGFLLHGDAQIDVLQLRRWRSARRDLLNTAVGAWFWFFNEAETWTEVPAEIDTPAMEHAMDILHDFRKDTFLNELYRGQVEYDRVERGAKKALERALLGEEQALERERAAVAAKEAAVAAKEDAVAREADALAAKEAAVTEAARLRALLAAAGIPVPEGE